MKSNNKMNKNSIYFFLFFLLWTVGSLWVIVKLKNFPDNEIKYFIFFSTVVILASLLLGNIKTIIRREHDVEIGIVYLLLGCFLFYCLAFGAYKYKNVLLHLSDKGNYIILSGIIICLFLARNKTIKSYVATFFFRRNAKSELKWFINRYKLNSINSDLVQDIIDSAVKAFVSNNSATKPTMKEYLIFDVHEDKKQMMLEKIKKEVIAKPFYDHYIDYLLIDALLLEKLKFNFEVHYTAESGHYEEKVGPDYYYSQTLDSVYVIDVHTNFELTPIPFQSDF